MQPEKSINNSLLSCLHALEIIINCNKFMLFSFPSHSLGESENNFEPFLLPLRPRLKNLSNLQCRNFVCQSESDLDFVLILAAKNI